MKAAASCWKPQAVSRTYDPHTLLSIILLSTEGMNTSPKEKDVYKRQTDYSVEFKKMYVIEDGTLYVINGGYVNIPQGYKSRDNDDNLVISAQFFEDYPNFFEESDGKMYTSEFTLNQKVIQPQAAMTIIDNATGQIKAMIGGRNTSGRKLFNRATSPRPVSYTHLQKTDRKMTALQTSIV